MKHKHFIISFFLIVILTLPLLNNQPPLGKDPMHYYNLAIYLSKGMGYQDYHLPQPQPHTYYPPGLPFLLFIGIKIFGENVLVAKIICLLFYIFSLFPLFLLLKEVLKDKNVIHYTILLFAVFPVGLVNAASIATEGTFLFFSFFSLYWFIKYLEKGNILFYFFTLIFVVMSFYIRTIGIILAVSMVIYLILKQKYKLVFYFVVPYCILISPWIIWNLAYKSKTYIDSFFMLDPYRPHLGAINLLGLMIRFYKNILYYVGKVFADTFFYPWLRNVEKGFNFLFIFKLILSTTLFFISGFAFWKKLRQEDIDIVDIYVIITLIICFLWVTHEPRFLLPIIPFICGYIIKYLEKIRPVFFNLFFIVFFFTQGVLIYKNKTMPESKFCADYRECMQWMKNNIPKNAITAALMPEGIYYYTGLKSVPYPLEKEYDKFKIKIIENKIEYIVVDRGETGHTDRAGYYLVPHLSKEGFTLVWGEDKLVKVYKIEKL